MISFKKIVEEVFKELGLLKEYKKVGSVQGYFEIWIYGNEGMLPHMHIDFNDGRKACVRLDTNSYFKHDAYVNELNAKDRKILYNYLNSIGDNGKTNYANFVDEWNKGTSPNKINTDNLTMPNYRMITDE